MTRLPVPRGVPPDAWARLTLFQQQVYRAVCAIPPGQTRSYGWVAEQIGRAGSGRAVGNALHRNPFAPLVPCHRVIRSDGTLGGYAHGTARKRARLQHEGWGEPRPEGRGGQSTDHKRTKNPSRVC